MKSEAARQFTLGLEPPAARRTRREFVLTETNSHALATLDRWRASGEPLLVITGPPASGKTHLLQILADESGAEVSVIDDADSTSDPKALLAAVERARETATRLAVAGRGDPGGWAQGLRDLQSRLAAATRIDLVEPDDRLLQAVILKLLADRQLRAGPELAAYAAARLPRTCAAAEAFVAALDAASIAQGAPVGLKLARNVLANLSEAPRPA
jgi:chromosomal replication initiation ATPase DnaA